MTTIAFVLGVLFMATGVAASIALHEVGHLVPAKRFGVRVTQYMVGLRPDRCGRAAAARPSTASRRSRSAATSG